MNLKFLKEVMFFVALSLLILLLMNASLPSIEVWKVGNFVLSIGALIVFMQLFGVKDIPLRFIETTGVAAALFAFSETEHGLLGFWIAVICLVALLILPARNLS